MKIGVLSDTHMPKRGMELPPFLLSALEGVDMIVHAGDLTQMWVLEMLSRIAPVTAVAGNVDPPEVALALGYKKVLEIEGKTIGVFHGHGSTGNTIDRAYKAFSKADCVIFGHSHIPYCLKQGSVLMFNPGSPTDKRKQPRYSFGLLSVDQNIKGSIVYFD